MICWQLLCLVSSANVSFLTIKRSALLVFAIIAIPGLLFVGYAVYQVQVVNPRITQELGDRPDGRPGICLLKVEEVDVWRLVRLPRRHLELHDTPGGVRDGARQLKQVIAAAGRLLARVNRQEKREAGDVDHHRGRGIVFDGEGPHHGISAAEAQVYGGRAEVQEDHAYRVTS